MKEAEEAHKLIIYSTRFEKDAPCEVLAIA
jgi:hypothetical protein